MAHSPDSRDAVRRIRRDERLPIDRIAARVGVPRSTVYLWVRDLPIPGSGTGGGLSESARRKGNLAMVRGRRAMREVAYQRGMETYAAFRCAPGFREVVTAYLAGGGASEPNAVVLSHRDRELMRLAHHWLAPAGGNSVRLRLRPGAGADGEACRRHWADALGVSAARIEIDPARPQSAAPSNVASASKPTPRDRESREPDVDAPSEPPEEAGPTARPPAMGTLRLSVSDTLLRTEVQAWADCLRSEWKRVD